MISLVIAFVPLIFVFFVPAILKLSFFTRALRLSISIVAVIGFYRRSSIAAGARRSACSRRRCSPPYGTCSAIPTASTTCISPPSTPLVVMVLERAFSWPRKPAVDRALIGEGNRHGHPARHSPRPPTGSASRMRHIVRPAPGDPARLEAYLPSPCVQNHAANIMPLRNGDLGCVWFGGTQEGIPDISRLVLPAGGGQRSLVRAGAAVRRPDPFRAEPDPVPGAGRQPVAAVDRADLRQPGHRLRPPPGLPRRRREAGDPSRPCSTGWARLACSCASRRRCSTAATAAADLLLPCQTRREMGRQLRHQRRA